MNSISSLNQSDGNRLVSGSTDLTIKVWDLSISVNWSSIACRVTMVGHTDTVRCLQMDRGRDRVISGSYDTTLKLWELRTGLCVKTLRGHTAPVLAIQAQQDRLVRSGLNSYRLSSKVKDYFPPVTQVGYSGH